MSDHDDESCDRCPASKPTPRVEDDEDIGLLVYYDLLCDENGRPTEGAFQFSQLLLKSTNSDQFPHNKCGESEGLSIEREVAARKQELIEQCRQLSIKKSEKIGRGLIPKGFAIAKVKELRQMRFETDEFVKKGAETIFLSEQIVFVLADGGPDKLHHSVMRLHEKIDRPLYKKLVARLRFAFRPVSAWNADPSSPSDLTDDSNMG
jgi:hypothetical protein